MPISDEYVNSLPEIYRDILAAFPRFNPTRMVGHGLSYQSLSSALDDKYRFGQIKTACENMAEGGVMEIRRKLLACPTPLGEKLITAITGIAAPTLEVPPFELSDDVDSLPEIYRDILAAFPRFNSTRMVGYGLSYQSLSSALDDKYRLDQIKTACENMAEGDVMEIKHSTFACPTPLGEKLITAITGIAAPTLEVDPFPPPQEWAS